MKKKLWFVLWSLLVVGGGVGLYQQLRPYECKFEPLVFDYSAGRTDPHLVPADTLPGFKVGLAGSGQLGYFRYEDGWFWVDRSLCEDKELMWNLTSKSGNVVDAMEKYKQENGL